MIKRLLIMVLLFSLVAGEASFPLYAAIQPKVTALTDISGIPEEIPIQRLFAMGLISGYPDSTFQPYNQVSLPEALALLHRVAPTNIKPPAQPKPAKNAVIHKVVQNYNYVPKWIQSDFTWAMKNELIPQQMVQGFADSRAATRGEVAALIANMLQLTSTAVDYSFPDVQPTYAYSEQVYAVKTANLMHGATDGNFYPDNPITRGDLAVIISNLIDNGKYTPPKGTIIDGWASNYQPEQSNGKKTNPATLAITSVDGSKTYKISPTCITYSNGVIVSPDNALNSQAQFVLNKSKQVAFINITGIKPTQPALTTDTYKVIAVGPNKDTIEVYDRLNTERTFNVGSDVAISGVSNGGIGSVKAGNFVELGLNGSTVETLNVLKVKTASATVTKITGGLLYISGQLTISPLQNWNWARIVDKDGNNAEVLRGDQIKVTYQSYNQIDEIVVTSRPKYRTVTGTILSISGGSQSQISITKNKYYSIDDAASITNASGNNISLSDLQVGDKVQLSLDGANWVMQIQKK